MEIRTNVFPQYMDHFRSQLLHLEVRGAEVGVLYDGGGHQDRHALMLELIQRSFEDFPSPRILRFWVFTGDNRPTDVVNEQPLLSIAGPRLRSDYIIPDPHCLRWPQAGVEDFGGYCEKIHQSSLEEPSQRAAVWRGLISQNPVRGYIVQAAAESADSTLDLQDVGPNVGDGRFLHMFDLPKWAVLVDMPGQGFSGRLKYLLHAHRPIIVFDRLDWDAVTVHLEPGFHYVSCPPDAKIFKYTVAKCLESYDRFVQRSLNASRLIKKLTERPQISSLLVKKALAVG